MKGWYESYFSPTFEVMRSYIDGIEEQAELSIQKFEKGKETYVLGDHPEEVRAVTVFQGLDDETWDINGIFRDYFPNLQRKSALLTLTGMFEHELDQLCDSYAKEKVE
ncbi:hypothetical protein [Vibrio cholerae]|uniref:hypothetical protein n=1 Tax=Vibrio cholerae TaxID=666 RepID=UPI0030805BC1